MPKIMIVDDDRTTVKLLQMLLEMDGFDVTVAARGHDALAKAHDVHPDVFLVDFHLTDMDGVELITNLRKMTAFASTPILVASGLDKEEDALAVGANRFLVKPFDPNTLTAILTDLLG